jgi:hypothetical protein
VTAAGLTTKSAAEKIQLSENNPLTQRVDVYIFSPENCFVVGLFPIRFVSVGHTP